MERNQEHLGIGVRIAAGFLVVLIFMVSLTVIGLRQVAETNIRLREIVENNNVKTELATAMQNALRERALSLHALSVLTDPFDKDAELQRFYQFGGAYLAARERLEKMPLTQEEREILDHIRSQMRKAHPEVRAVAEMAMRDSGPEIFDRIRNIALPWQRRIVEEVDILVRLQQRQTAIAVRKAEASNREVHQLMLLLGGSAFFIGLVIAFLASRYVSRQARQLVTQAMYDTLTGLPNRNLMQDRLDQAIAQSRRSQRGFGIALMDLNRFKEINDTLGHDVGDELLREVGRRLKDMVRAEDTVARMGGDEFVLILPGMDEAALPAFAGKLHATLNPPFHWEGHAIDISASVGISLFPSQAEDAGSLIRYADIAMYAAKRAGAGHALYTPEYEQVSRSDLSLKSELREAIQSGQLCLRYQPKIEHLSRRVVGLEALVCWNHPQRGWLPPEKFITLAEESGLIGQLTHWVLETALAELAALNALGHHLNMAVNISARSLHDLELPQTILAMLHKHGLLPERLTLEITENAVMSNPASASTILGKLDRMGVTLAIDDFGTGYSSLAHLKQLPVDEIKIDKSFVIDMEENENDAVIVRSIIDLAHNLGLRVVAEGVENEDAWITLSVLGCDLSQGFCMSKPLAPDDLLHWLKESPLAAAIPANYSAACAD